MPQKEVVTTEVDELIKLVETKKEISIADAAKALTTSEAAVEQFADLLQEEGIIELKYKFTTPYLCFKGGDRAEHLMAEQKKAESFYIGAQKQEEEEDSGVSNAEDDEDIPESLRKKGFGRATVEEKQQAPATAVTPVTNAVEVPEPNATGHNAIVSEDGKQKIAETATELAKPKPIDEKISDFNSAILQVYEDMKNGNFETAKQLYGLITHYYEALPERYSSEKDKIVDQLVDLSKKLAINIDMFNENDFNDKVKKITELGKLCYNLIDKKNFNDASQKFNELKEQYAQLPFGFLEKKTELHDKLVKLHEVLVNSRTKVYAADLNRKLMIIGKLLENAWNAVEKEDVDNAAKAYQEIRNVQKTLPAGFMQKKILIGEKITEFYQELAAIKGEVFVEEFNSKKALIRSLISQAQSVINAVSSGKSTGSSGNNNIENNNGNNNNGNNNIENAVALFKQAKQALAGMPRGFLEEKSALQAELFNIDKQLLQVKLRVTKADLADKRNKILALINIAEKYANKGEPDLGATVYDEILNIYNTLPAGYLEEKTRLKTKMLDVYKRSVLAADSLYLKNVEAKVQEHYTQLLQLIINAHKHVEARDFKALSTDYGYIRKVYEELPVGFIKNRLKIIDEIAKIGAELEILGKTEELKNTYVDDHKNAKKLIEEIYRIYDYLLENAPEDRQLLYYVKDTCGPYTIRLLEKGALRIKRAKTSGSMSHEITAHAKSAIEAKKGLEQQRKAANIELEQKEKDKAVRLNVIEKEKQEFMSELLDQKQDALMHELKIEKERDVLLKERDKVWQSKQELQAVMNLNEEVLREKEQLKKLQEKQQLRKAKEDFIRKQIEQIKKEQQDKEQKLKQEEEEKKKELEQLEELKLQEKEKFNLIKELERVRQHEQKTLQTKKKEHDKLIKERVQIKEQVAKLKKNASKSNLKKIKLLNQSDAKLRKKLSAFLKSRSSRSDAGISPEFIPKEKKLLGIKLSEKAEPVELGEIELAGSQEIAGIAKSIHAPASPTYSTPSPHSTPSPYSTPSPHSKSSPYSTPSYSALPGTEIDEEILKLEQEMQEENSKTLGLEEEQAKFDAQLELMAPEQPAPAVKAYDIEKEHEIEQPELKEITKAQPGQDKPLKQELKQELKPKTSKKEMPGKEQQKAQKQETAHKQQKAQAPPLTWLEKKQLEIQRKLELLDQGLLSEPKKGKSA